MMGPVRQDAIELVSDRLLKEQQWWLGYTVDMLNYC